MPLKKSSIVIITSILIFLTRFINLTKLPIFNDEAIYLDWGFRQINAPGHAYYSLYDGKQPLLIWIFGLSQKIFSNPLFAGRIISVLTGITTAIGIYSISKHLYNKKTAIVSVFVYFSIPIYAFFDRQALMESTIATIGVWIFYIFLKLLKNQHSTNVIMLSVLLAMGFFIKSSAIIYYLCLVFFTLVLHFKYCQKKSLFLTYILAAVFISQAFLLPLYSQSQFWSSLSDNSRYIRTFSELYKFPIKQIFNNIISSIDILFWQLSPPIALFFIFELLNNKNKTSKSRLIYFWILFQITIVVLISKSINPRYLVSFTPLIIIPASKYLTNLFDKSNYHKLIAIFSLIFTLSLSLFQNFNPQTYMYNLNKVSKQSQYNTYITGWTSGFGLDPVLNYLKEISSTKQLIVAVRLDSGNPESAIFTYYAHHQNITPTYMDKSLVKPEFFENDCISSKSKLMYVSRSGNLGGMEKYFQEINRFYKPNSQEYIGIHELIPNCEGKTIYL